jgi:hypothetical protein
LSDGVFQQIRLEKRNIKAILDFESLLTKSNNTSSKHLEEHLWQDW